MDGMDLPAYKSRVLEILGGDYQFDITEDAWTALREKLPDCNAAASVISLGVPSVVKSEGYTNDSPIHVDIDYLANAEKVRQDREGTREFERGQVS